MHFLVRDQATGAPVAGVPYRLTLESGKALEGVTSATGLTQTISADSALTATLEVPYYGDSSDNVDAGIGHDTCRH